jgi:Fe-S cluster biogenesis protein NfuA
MAEEQHLRAVGDRIETLIGELGTIAEPRARETAEELVRRLLEFYGAGLARMVELVGASSAAAPLLAGFEGDDLVATLLLLHGIHPRDLAERVVAALDRVRPTLGAHGGDVTLLGIEGGIVRLRLEGSCHGCPSSLLTMKSAIEREIAAAAPEVGGIEVEGLVEEGPPIVRAIHSAPPAASASPLVQIGRAPHASTAPAVSSAPAAPSEHCELCAKPIGERHSHLVDVEKRTLLCACRPCWLLFTTPGVGRYRAVPERTRSARDLVWTDAQWDQVQVPVDLAFFFFNSTLGRPAAFYPSPAGATESLLPLATWDEVVRANPLLADLALDVEALLVWKRPTGYEGHVVPVDVCYELVGIIRRHWRGFHGGDEAWQAIEAFFAGLREGGARGDKVLAPAVPAFPQSLAWDKRAG